MDPFKRSFIGRRDHCELKGAEFRILKRRIFPEITDAVHTLMFFEPSNEEGAQNDFGRVRLSSRLGQKPARLLQLGQ